MVPQAFSALSSVILFQVSLDSVSLAFLDLVFQVFWIRCSRFLRIRCSRLFWIWCSRFFWIRCSRFLRIRCSRLFWIWCSRFSGSGVPGFSGSGVPGFSGSGVSNLVVLNDSICLILLIELHLSFHL